MAQNSPQAVNIPSFLTAGDFLKNITAAAKNDMDQQGLIDGTAVAAIGAGPYKIPQDNNRTIAKRFIQNCGTTAVKYKVCNRTSADQVSANNFNGILAAGNAQDDGLGSQIDLSHEDGEISIMVDSGNLRVALHQSYIPGMVARTNNGPAALPPA